MRTILGKYAGGPVGLNTIAASVGEDANTIEEVYEPYLLQLGFLDRTKRGRVATRRAYEQLGLAYPNDSEPSGSAQDGPNSAQQSLF